MMSMTSNERIFSQLLLDFSLLVIYPQPMIEGMTQIPDYYIFNTNMINNTSSFGKFVELTLFSREDVFNYDIKNKGIKRKRRQLKAF